MYAITKQTHHYAGTFGADDRELLVDQHGATLTASSAREAAALVNELDLPTWLSHGEYATPTYRVVKVNSERYQRLYRRTFGGEG